MIHPSAIVEKGAQLGERVTLGPFSFIDADTVVGDDCLIGPHVVIHRHTTLGARSRVHANAVLGDLPQDTSFKNVVSYARIGDACVIREGVTIHRGTKEATATVIGNGCMLMANSHVAHNVQMGNHVILANGALLAGYAELGDRTFVSGNSAVHQFCRIGRLAMLGGVSVVTKDVPPFCIHMTGACNRIAGLNIVGLRRAGLTAAQRKSIQHAFNMVYRSGLNVTQALERLRADAPDELACEFIAFVASSKRGIVAYGGETRVDEES